MNCGQGLEVVEQIKWHLAEVLGQPGVSARMVLTNEDCCRQQGDPTWGLKTYVLTVSETKKATPEPYKPSADDPVFIEAVRAAVAKIAEPPDEDEDEDDDSCTYCGESDCDCEDDEIDWI